jgi:anti-sigma-K factor RskA
MTATDHIEELAELYAIGSLDRQEREQVERHVAGCARCASRLDEAERAVAEMAAGQPQYEPPSALRERLRASVAPPRARAAQHWGLVGLAFAAALAIAFIPTWLAVDRTRVVSQAMRQDERALAQLAKAQAFNRADFMARNKPMDAKVLYGTKGDWYYVIVMHPRPGMQVAYVHGGRMEMLGTVAMHGESGTLYLPVNHKMDELALLEDNKVVADAHLVY